MMILGLDVGGTKARIGVFDNMAPDLVASTVYATPRGVKPDTVIDALEGWIRETVQGYGDRLSAVKGIGIGMPGPVNMATGTVIKAPNLPGWDHVPLADILKDRLGVPVFVGNDADVAALGEYRYGSGEQADHLLYLTVSTGIGGSVVILGRPYGGTSGMAGEIGHIYLAADRDAPKCGAGHPGCWEAYASGTAIARMAQERLRYKTHTTSSLATIEDITARDVFMAAQQGDAIAADLVAEEIRYLGVGLASMIHTLNPERVVIGGGIASGLGEAGLHAVGAVMRDLVFDQMGADVTLVLAQLGDDAGLYGARALVR